MIINRMASNVDPDEMAHYEPPHLDLHCLPWYLYLSTELKGFTTYGLAAEKMDLRTYANSENPAAVQSGQDLRCSLTK